MINVIAIVLMVCAPHGWAWTPPMQNIQVAGSDQESCKETSQVRDHDETSALQVGIGAHKHHEARGHEAASAPKPKQQKQKRDWRLWRQWRQMIQKMLNKEKKKQKKQNKLPKATCGSVTGVCSEAGALSQDVCCMQEDGTCLKGLIPVDMEKYGTVCQAAAAPEPEPLPKATCGSVTGVCSEAGELSEDVCCMQENGSCLKGLLPVAMEKYGTVCQAAAAPEPSGLLGHCEPCTADDQCQGFGEKMEDLLVPVKNPIEGVSFEIPMAERPSEFKKYPEDAQFIKTGVKSTVFCCPNVHKCVDAHIDNGSC